MAWYDFITSAADALGDAYDSLGIPLPPGVEYLAEGVQVVGDKIITATGIQYNIADLGITYAIDKAGNVLSMARNELDFILNPVTKEVYKGYDTVATYADGVLIKAMDLLPGGKYYEIIKQLSGMGGTLNKVAIMMDNIAYNSGRIVNELSDWAS